MRKTLFFFGLFLSGIGANAQVTFKTIYGTPLCEQPVSITNTDAGGYAMGGYTTAFTNSMNFQLVVTNSNGDTLWTREYDTGGDDYLSDMIHTSDGGYMMVGYTNYFTTNFQEDILAIKVDVSGAITWMNTYSMSANSEDVPYDVIQTSDGGYAIVGWSDNSSPNGGTVLKVDGSGVLMWMNNYAINATEYSRFTCIAEASNGDLVFSGGSYIATHQCIELFRVTSAGITVWCRKLSAASEFVPVSIAINSMGDIYLGGTRDLYTFPFVPGGMFVIKFNNAGLLQWSSEYSIPGQNASGVNRVKMLASGDLCVVGRASLTTTQGVIYTLDPAGVNSFAYNYTDTTAYEYVDVTNGNDGGLAILSEKDYAFGVEDTSSYLLIKTTANMSAQCGVNIYPVNRSAIVFADTIKTVQATAGGLSSPVTAALESGLTIISVCSLVGIAEISSGTSIKIYPQPAQEQLTITLNEASGTGHRDFVLYNDMGQIVLTKQLTAVETIISCRDLAPGIYFYSLLAEGELISSGKLIKD
jgi:hypothetical protein